MSSSSITSRAQEVGVSKKIAHRTLYSHAMFHEDDLGVVLRGMVWIEGLLREYIEAVVDDNAPIQTFLDNAGFARKLEWAQALGLKITDKDVDAINRLAGLRNKLAHELGATLTEPEVNDLFGRLSDNDKTLVGESMRKRRSNPYKMKPAWKERLRYCTTALVAGMIAYVEETLKDRKRTRRRSSRKKIRR